VGARPLVNPGPPRANLTGGRETLNRTTTDQPTNLPLAAGETAMPASSLRTACRALLACCCLVSVGRAAADERDALKVGLQPDGRIVVPTNQVLKPAGTQVTFPGRPVDLLLVDGGRTLVVKNSKSLLFLDAGTGA